MKFLFLLLLTLPTLGQTLPDRGSIADLKGMSKVYVVANHEIFKLVKKDLAKRFTLVDKVADADFFLEYTVLRTERVTSLDVPSETDQLDAYTMRENVKTVAWSDSHTDGFSEPASRTLTKRFIKAFTTLSAPAQVK